MEKKSFLNLLEIYQPENPDFLKAKVKIIISSRPAPSVNTSADPGGKARLTSRVIRLPPPSKKKGGRENEK